MAKKEVVPEEPKTYKFDMPDRSVKHPFDKVTKTPEQLKEEWVMVDTAIKEVAHTTETVKWNLLIVDPRLTATFVEAKTGLVATLKKLIKVRDAIEQEIRKNERLEGK